MATPTIVPQTGWPTIPEFYAQKDVFITGATGFVGKCLVEKLLRSLPDLGRLFVLVRRKKGKSGCDRVAAMLESKVFDTLRNERPGVFKKVVPVPGDLEHPGLGLSEGDLQLLVNNVSVIFHMAATIRFNASLRESLQMNVVGVLEVIKLCRKLKKLVSLVHVSTAYAHCNRTDVIEETVYPPKVHPNNVLSLLDWMTEQQLDYISPCLLEGRPNTYTYTKALAEYVLISEAKGLPVAIYRPSIVGAAYKEPYPGWVDCIHGPSGMFIAIGKGMLKVLRFKGRAKADIVPVDLAANMLIAVGWITGLKPTSGQSIIYHFTSGATNPVNWFQMRTFPAQIQIRAVESSAAGHYLVKSYTANPFDQVFRRPGLLKCTPTSFWPYWDFIIHLGPCFLIDILLRVTGKKPRMLRQYKRMTEVLVQVDYFTQNDWNWTNTNCDKLLALMGKRDRKVFDFDIRKLDWETYIEVFCMGTKQYLLNEDVANLPVARRQLKRLRNISYLFNVMVLLVTTAIIFQKSKTARDVWKTALGLCLFWITKLGTSLSLLLNSQA